MEPLNFDLNKIKNAKTDGEKEVSDTGENILNPDIKRDENQKSNIHNIKMCGFWFLAFLGACLAFVTMWHMLMPVHCRWLNDVESSNLKSIFVTGLGAGIIGKFGNKLVP